MKKLLGVFALICFSFALNAQKKDLNQYVGIYKFEGAPFVAIEITTEGGLLIADADGVGKGEIEFTDNEDEFTEPNYSATLKFVRDDKGKVVKLKVAASGMDLEGLKDEVKLSDFVGKYELKDSPSIAELEIQLRNEVLYAIATMGESSLSPAATQDTYYLDATDGGISFKRDENGKVVGIEVMFMGNVVKGKKK